MWITDKKMLINNISMKNLITIQNSDNNLC